MNKNRGFLKRFLWQYYYNIFSLTKNNNLYQIIAFLQHYYPGTMFIPNLYDVEVKTPVF